jgi:hypothetical protein
MRHALTRSIAFASLLACACAAPASGLEPGEHVLEATGLSGLPTLQLRVWLPEGARAGAPVWIADDQGLSLIRASGAFDAAGVTSNLCARPGCLVELRAVDRCAATRFDEVLWFSFAGGDVPSVVDGEADACAIDADPLTGVLTLGVDLTRAEAIAPIRRIELRPSVPVDVATLAALRLTVDGEHVDTTYEGDGWGGALVLALPLDPTGVIALDAGGTRDVLGREYLPATLRAPATRAVLEDPSFDTEPTEGAIAWAGHELAVRDGALRMRDEGRWPRVPFAAVVALGDPGAATTLRLDAEVAARELGGHVTAHVVRAGGAAADPLMLRMGLRTETALPIPAGTGAVWLVLHSAQAISQPRDMHSPDVLAVHGLALE